MDNITLKIMATQKVSTVNPPTILVHNSITKAFITKRNNPNVTIVKGNVSSTIIGLIKILSSPSTTATTIAVKGPATLTPGKKCAIPKTKAVVTIILIIKPIITNLKFQ